MGVYFDQKLIFKWKSSTKFLKFLKYYKLKIMGKPKKLIILKISKKSSLNTNHSFKYA